MAEYGRATSRLGEGESPDYQAQLTDEGKRARLLACTLAAALVPEAIIVLAELMRSSKRDQVRRGAAKDIIQIATDTVLGIEIEDEKPEKPESATGGKVYLVDSAKAGELLKTAGWPRR